MVCSLFLYGGLDRGEAALQGQYGRRLQQPHRRQSESRPS